MKRSFVLDLQHPPELLAGTLGCLYE
jgi:hypothetical protein